jgi:hypothetical protein
MLRDKAGKAEKAGNILPLSGFPAFHLTTKQGGACEN